MKAAFWLVLPPSRATEEERKTSKNANSDVPFSPKHRHAPGLVSPKALCLRCALSCCGTTAAFSFKLPFLYSLLRIAELSKRLCGSKAIYRPSGSYLLAIADGRLEVGANTRSESSDDRFNGKPTRFASIFRL